MVLKKRICMSAFAGKCDAHDCMCREKAKAFGVEWTYAVMTIVVLIV